LVASSKSVWEQALNDQITSAEKAGIEYASGHGVEMLAFPAEEQRKLDDLYNRFALEQARRLKAVGLDGIPVFQEAQRLIAAGQIACPAPQHPIGAFK